MSKVSRPLNYYGSKQNMCKKIHSLVPDNITNWVDVFCGSAIVTLRKDPHPREVINDLNDDVINLFNVLRSNSCSDLLSLIELTPFSQEQLRLRYQEQDSIDPVERAHEFLIESWFGRGGDAHKTGFRWSKGSTIAPEIVWSRLPARLKDCADRLKNICIRKDDAFKVIDDYDVEHTLFFVDPPYPGPAGKRYQIKFSDSEQERLARRLKHCKANVILTMPENTIYSEILSDWNLETAKVVNVANKVTRELILFNFDREVN